MEIAKKEDIVFSSLRKISLPGGEKRRGSGPMTNQRKKLKRVLLPIALFASFSLGPPGHETRISFPLLVVVNNCMLSYLRMIRSRQVNI